MYVLFVSVFICWFVCFSCVRVFVLFLCFFLSLFRCLFVCVCLCLFVCFVACLFVCLLACLSVCCFLFLIDLVSAVFVRSVCSPRVVFLIDLVLGATLGYQVGASSAPARKHRTDKSILVPTANSAMGLQRKGRKRRSASVGQPWTFFDFLREELVETRKSENTARPQLRRGNLWRLSAFRRWRNV